MTDKTPSVPTTEDAEFIARIQAGMLNDDSVMALADLFRLFGDSTRVRLLWALNEGDMCVQSLSDILGVSVSAVSHQLKLLKDANLVRGRRDGKNVIYSLCDEHVRYLMSTALIHLRERQQ